MITLEWTAEGVRMIDQRKLPTEEIYVNCTTYKEVAVAIEQMVIRGAPAIGVAAAMGVALGISKSSAVNLEELSIEFKVICKTLASTRPTAVNLFWAISRMDQVFNSLKHLSINDIKENLVLEAIKIYSEDIEINKRIGLNGAELIQDGFVVLTHCNAGALATAGYGTALGIIRAAIEQGKQIKVIADETRPFLQGARLTAWELAQDNIPVTLITDSMAGHFMQSKQVDCVIVGADRVAANGDVANKIGTYSVAVLAQYHRIPFYVAAPISTLDLTLNNGHEIPIENRPVDEVAYFNGKAIAPLNVEILNPAFDITPHELVSAIITERGVAKPNYNVSLKSLFSRTQAI